ncbi:hypothetical protein GO755_29545 [Spirosoma sp. HMF4905]|uniref:AntA/AntB antirepressor domain-containing protein n=1 Tax=Spirosoma arboris TaxID=2682092 RepID=A0A7K1SK83_9BACT|nr:antA/AntB antirepressor family protein [Spirosoma arboris]MVM34212.1 hypothetical protein [Spirosoma arboris]
MNELISITTGVQGSPVVSARELHGFLSIKSKFADWIKNRIIKYKLLENEDYVLIAEEGFSKSLEKGGRPELDYALTLDTAKELAMVENNEKGREARRYFIEKEKQLRQLIDAPVSTEQVLIQLVSQQVQLMADTQQMLNQLRLDVDSIMHGQKPPSAKPSRSGKQLSLPGLPPSSRRSSAGSPSSSLRQLIHTRVIEYCGYHEATTQETYNYLYKRMFEVYSISVYRLVRMGTESLLDAVERYGHLDRLYSLVMAELHYNED